MENRDQQTASPRKPKKRLLKNRAIKSVLNIAILVGVLFVGINIGNGTISITTPVQSNKQLSEKLDYSGVNNLYNMLRANYDGSLSEEKLIDGLKEGLVKASGDPYTEYLNAKEAKEFNEQLSGTFSGIGAQLGKDDNDAIIVVAPISGYPAEKAGLRAQDVIVGVNGTTTAGMSIDEAVSKIRGPKDTKVKLEIIRNGKERKELEITRQDIKIPSVEHEILPENIGYIQITQFWNDTANLVNEAVSEFKQAGVKRVIVDLRSNPGGSLEAAVDVANIWLPQGKTILQEKRDNKVIQTYTATGSASLLNTPTVVLINEGSASASEIVAGALKDNNAATLIGVKSYGKGSVQKIIPLGNGGELKVTVARWFRPNGQNIDKKGIKPDTEIKLSDEDYASGNDKQKDAAVQFLVK